MENQIQENNPEDIELLYAISRIVARTAEWQRALDEIIQLVRADIYFRQPGYLHARTRRPRLWK